MPIGSMGPNLRASERFGSDPFCSNHFDCYSFAGPAGRITRIIGAMVMRAEEPVPCHEFVLLKVLAQQTAAAMAGADLIDSERRQRFRLRELTDQH
jgi:hypothetical protein